MARNDGMNYAPEGKPLPVAGSGEFIFAAVALDHGKDYFTDKTPFTALEQLEAAKSAIQRTGRKYMV